MNAESQKTENGVEIRIPGVEEKPFPELVTISSGDFILSSTDRRGRIHHLGQERIRVLKAKYDRDVLMAEWVKKHEPKKERHLGVPGTPTNNLLIEAVDLCFSHHVPLSLSPEVIWYVIANEIATTVKKNPKKYAHLFTKSPEKEKLTVRVDDYIYGQPNDWGRDIPRFEKLLLGRVPSSIMEDMMPDLSTLGADSEIAMLLTFMDAASPFYSYAMSTLCGIPLIRLEGVSEDWINIRESAGKLAGTFPDLRSYFKNLIPILRELENTAKGESPSLDFWSSIYKRSHGSGGPFLFGWILNLWAYHSMENGKLEMKRDVDLDWTNLNHNSGMTTSCVPIGVSQVDFVWEYLSKNIPMKFVGGIVSTEDLNGYITPKTGFAVLESSGEENGNPDTTRSA